MNVTVREGLTVTVDIVGNTRNNSMCLAILKGGKIQSNCKSTWSLVHAQSEEHTATSITEKTTVYIKDEPQTKKNPH